MANDPFEYDVALSFAGDDRVVAEEIRDLLISRNIHVFLDDYQAGDTKRPEQQLMDHLVNLYARKARYCVLLISRRYPLKSWTEAERTAMRELALRDPDEYILPIQLDDSKIPGITEAKGYTDLRQDPIEKIANLLEQKLQESRTRSRPPSPSHDLRSGSIPHDKT
jgi:hypothetical protein